MRKITDAKLVVETQSKDALGQTKTTKSYKPVLGNLRSLYGREFYQAEQFGVRPEGCIETCAFDYNGERKILIDEKEFTIYRTFTRGTDRIELYYGERVGNG